MTTGLLSLDARLAQHAEQKGSKPLGLETVEGQFRALAGVPEADQIEMLKAGVRYYDRIDDYDRDSWCSSTCAGSSAPSGQLQLALSEKVGVSPKVFDSAEQAMLGTRNLGMRDKALPLRRGRRIHRCGRPASAGQAGPGRAVPREAGYTVTALE